MPWKKAVATAAVAFAFGIAYAIVKGQSADARDAIGNMSAPWLLLPFVAGALWYRASRGMIAGLLATAIALSGFYIAEAFILDLGGGHSLAADLHATIQAGRIYFVGGVLTGPIFGALGGIFGARRTLVAAAPILLAFLLEPAAVWMFEHATGGQGGAGSLTHYPALWLGEIALGLVGTAWLMVARRTA